MHRVTSDSRCSSRCSGSDGTSSAISSDGRAAIRGSAGAAGGGRAQCLSVIYKSCIQHYLYIYNTEMLLSLVSDRLGRTHWV